MNQYPSKVYIVFKYFIYVDSVHSTKEKAQEAIERYRYELQRQYSIEEWIVDDDNLSK